VIIADPLTIPQAQLIEAGLKQPEGHEGEDRIWLSVIDVMNWQTSHPTPSPPPRVVTVTS
jgi:hypothetical protein